MHSTIWSKKESSQSKVTWMCGHISGTCHATASYRKSWYFNAVLLPFKNSYQDTYFFYLICTSTMVSNGFLFVYYACLVWFLVIFYRIYASDLPRCFGLKEWRNLWSENISGNPWKCGLRIIHKNLFCIISCFIRLNPHDMTWRFQTVKTRCNHMLSFAKVTRCLAC